MREFKLSYLNIYTVLRDLFRNIWVIVLCAAIGFLGTYSFISYLYVPKYTSTMTVAVTSKDTETNVSNLSKTIEVAEILQGVFKSSVIRQMASKELASSFDGTISASQNGETNMLTISVTAASPLEAYLVLCKVYESYDELTDYTFEDIILSVLNSPSVPSCASNAMSPKSTAAKAGIALSALCAAAIAVLSFLRDTVKNEDNLEDLLDAKLFGTVYHERRSKNSVKKLNTVRTIKINDPLVNFSFSESIRKLAVKLDYLFKAKGCKTVMITSADEHEGKTTIAVNVGIALAAMGRRVAIIDADLRKPRIIKFFGNAVSTVNRCDGKDEIDREIGDFFLGKTSAANVVRYDKETGVFVLCGKKSFRNSSEILSGERFAKMMSLLRNNNDIVIIDTPPVSLVADAETIAEKADATIVVVRQDNTPVGQINDVLDRLYRCDTEVLGCVFNDVRTLSNSMLSSGISWKNRYGYSYGSYYYH